MRFLSMIMAAFMLSSCTPIGAAVGTGAALGVASQQEGGLSGAADDFMITARINDLWFKYNIETFRKLNLNVDQGRVLVTGVVQDPDARVEAIRLVWQVKGVRQVINEVRVADSEGIPGYLRDQWIATRLRTALTFDRKVHSINYSIETVQGTVYLMGYARSQEELDHVIGAARIIPGVRQVVSYVKLPGEVLPDQEMPGSMPASEPQSFEGADPYATQEITPVTIEAKPLDEQSYGAPDMEGTSGGKGYMQPDGTWVSQ